MPRAIPTPSVEVLSSIFSYDEETGELRWKKVPQERVVRSKVGAIAGAVTVNGYRMVKRRIIALGGFDRLEDAAAVVADAREKLHGEFARTT